jgi:hypothetical protein
VLSPLLLRRRAALAPPVPAIAGTGVP